MSKGPNITSASIFPRLRVMLQDDIDTLGMMISVRTNESKMYDLITSLQEVKRKLIDILPGESDYYEGGATTHTSSHTSGYVGANVTEVKDQYKMVSILLAMETDQMKLVRNALASEGLPDDLENKLKGIANIYSSIVEQLGTAKNTQQINPIAFASD